VIRLLRIGANDARSPDRQIALCANRDRCHVDNARYARRDPSASGVAHRGTLAFQRTRLLASR
jgi:hypothetical protein